MKSTVYCTSLVYSHHLEPQSKQSYFLWLLFEAQNQQIFGAKSAAILMHIKTSVLCYLLILQKLRYLTKQLKHFIFFILSGTIQSASYEQSAFLNFVWDTLLEYENYACWGKHQFAFYDLLRNIILIWLLLKKLRSETNKYSTPTVWLHKNTQKWCNLLWDVLEQNVFGNMFSRAFWIM